MKKGMIKVIVLYPNDKGKTFDMDYYCNKHMPMVAESLGTSLKGLSVDKGLGGAVPGADSPYVAVGNLYFESIQAFQSSFGPHAAKIAADLQNYTNTEPVVIISEVMV
ncbi:MAG TPA: EthD family reductase [Cyclobacteriaceae bacterium]|nr:EthD family reductase [Cyclobacteriaceae bacterium]